MRLWRGDVSFERWMTRSSMKSDVLIQQKEPGSMMCVMDGIDMGSRRRLVDDEKTQDFPAGHETHTNGSREDSSLESRWT
eukprot:scaffold2992_cov214-Amphora_coffeaeformis.AAC.41